MPKTTKKPAKKIVAKKAPAKKAAKKVVKPVAAPKPVLVEIPEPDRFCHCTKRKRNIILASVFVGSFIVGFMISQLFFCPGHHGHKLRVEFVNGCLNAESITCPKLLKDLPIIDTDHDGCVTKEEMHNARKAMRHHKKSAPVEEPAVVDAIAPVME